MSPLPKVSVVMITYNHEAYIDRAIASVMEQAAPFPVELIIGEDCSTDGTRARVAAWVERFPDRILPLYHPTNVGMFANSNAVMRACRGEFVASLEGDDYWTDPNKLRLQVECLERDPGASLCFHLLDALEQSTGVVTPPWTPREFRRSGLTAEELMQNSIIGANSRMWRRALLPEMDPCMARLKVLDIPQDILLAARGRVVFLDRVMGVYRMHAGGAWTGQSLLAHKRASYEWLRCFYDHRLLPDRYRPLLKRLLVAVHVQVVAEQGKLSKWRMLGMAPGFLLALAKMNSGDRRRYVRWFFGTLLRPIS